MKIVLVHGIFNTGHVLFWLKKALEDEGHECFAPNLWPCDGSGGIERISEILKTKVDEHFGGSESIVMIGFSMGGIVARYYLQSLGGKDRTRAFFSIATPHHGSYWAYLPYPSKGVQQLKPNSEFLNELRENQDQLLGIRLYSYWTPYDTSVVPSSSSRWSIAENKTFNAWLHITIIFNQALIDEILQQLN